MKSVIKSILLGAIAFMCLSISPHTGTSIQPSNQVYEEKEKVVPLENNFKVTSLPAEQFGSVMIVDSAKFKFVVYPVGFTQQISSTEFLRNFHRYKGKPIPIVPKYQIACI